MVENAHPLTGCDEREIAVVLNGIIENYRELRASLIEDGHRFTTETDAETVAHLIESHYDGDLAEAVRLTYRQLEGHFAFVVIHRDNPELIVGTRRQCPLVIGVGEGEGFIASNTVAFLSETRNVQFPDDGDIAVVTPDGVTYIERARRKSSEVEHDTIAIDWDEEQAEKGGYETFMLKEIYEQATAVRETLAERIRYGKLTLEGLGLSDDELRNLRRIVILACGTAYHAGVAGRYVIEEWARVPVEHDIASEWRYRNPVLDKNTLVIGISQSGETRDTIDAMAAGAPAAAPARWRSRT